MSLFFEDDLDDMYDYLPGEYVYGEDMYVPDEYMDEKWWYTGVPGYMISNYGRVWSEKSQCFMKPKPMDKHGHMGVCLTHKGKPCYFYIHRLMAMAFIPNPDKHPIVRHLDDIPNNNELENLAWGTQKDNWKDCVNNGHYTPFTDEARRHSIEKSRTPVMATNVKTGEQHLFDSQRDAADTLGLQQANIWKVLNGQRAHTEGWYFEYIKRGDDV